MTHERRLDVRIDDQAWSAFTKPALFTDGGSLSYVELGQRVQALAGRLLACGVTSRSIVAICLERSAEFVIAALGVARTNAAFLPLDNSYPLKRVEMLIRDGGVDVVVTTRGLHQRHQMQFGRCEVVYAEDARTAVATHSLPPLSNDAQEPAYCIYTSGSTGVPKGVLNTQAGLANRIEWMRRAYGVCEDDVVLHKTPCTFDVSVWELFLPFAAGASLVVAKPDGHRDVAYLIETIVARGVTLTHFVPSMLRLFLSDPGAARCTSLRHVFCSGESLTPDLVDAFFTTLPGSRLHNLYGPTEAAIDVTAYECTPEDRLRQRVPIGKAITGMTIQVLDSRTLLPVATGETGELCISGIGTALGYLNQPELTASKFVVLPPRAGGVRAYLTGDQGRVLASGDIEFLGRLDLQVKVNGSRVELEEIENIARRCEGVADCAVAVEEVRAGSTRLVAYVVPFSSPPDRGRLRAELASHLPSYAVPHAIEFAAALPLSASGKLDRAALRHLAQADGTVPWPVVRHMAGALEADIASVWTSVFASEDAASKEFHSLGGTSLMAIAICARLSAEKGVRVEVAEFLGNPSVAKLAKYLRARGEAPATVAPLPPLLPAGAPS